MKKDLIIHARTTHVALATLVRYAELTTGLPRSKADVVSSAVELVARLVGPRIDEEFTTSSAKAYLERVLPSGGVSIPRNLYENLLAEELQTEGLDEDSVSRAVKEAIFKNRRK